MDEMRMAIDKLFQSTLPVGGATTCQYLVVQAPESFNPRSPWEERHWVASQSDPVQTVSIHAPRGRSDHHHTAHSTNTRGFNPRSPWEERLKADGQQGREHHVSIHAPRGRSDLSVSMEY